MIEIIPAILVQSETEFDDRIKTIGNLANRIQIDVLDGIFVPFKNWADPGAIQARRLSYEVEAHLMVRDPQAVVDDWILAGARAILPHLEADGALAAARRARSRGLEAGVAINPETPLDLLRDKIFDLDFVCVMGVTPGQSGQKFDESAIQKVADLRAAYPDLRIEVDGGVNQETIAPLVRAGATALVVSSALFKSPNFGAAYRSLQAAANI